MQISLIIPIYNAESFLPRLFDNIVAQGVFRDGEEFGEVIFVNDGSSDDSKAMILEFGRSHTWVRYIEQKNQGQHIARNTGIKAAKGDYIAFMDQDDAYTVDSLKVMLKGAEQNDADILRGRFSLAKDLEYNKWQLYRCDGSEKSTVECGTDYIIRRNGLHYDDFVWASLYRRSFLVHHGFMFHHLVRYNEDGAFVWQVIPEAKKIVCLESVVYLWIQRDMSESHNASIEHRLKREGKAEQLAVFMHELYLNNRGKNDFPSQILGMIISGKYWSCYKYLGTMVKFRGLTKWQIHPMIKRIKEEGIYPYPHQFPKDLPEGWLSDLFTLQDYVASDVLRMDLEADVEIAHS